MWWHVDGGWWNGDNFNVSWDPGWGLDTWWNIDWYSGGDHGVNNGNGDLGC